MDPITDIGDDKGKRENVRVELKYDAVPASHVTDTPLGIQAAERDMHSTANDAANTIPTTGSAAGCVSHTPSSMSSVRSEDISRSRPMGIKASKKASR